MDSLFADLRGGLAREKGVVFLRGGLIPRCTLWKPRLSFIQQTWGIFYIKICTKWYDFFVKLGFEAVGIWWSLSYLEACTYFTLISHDKPAGIYLLKVTNRNTIARCEICSKLTTETPGANSLVLAFLLITLNIFHTLFCCFYF